MTGTAPRTITHGHTGPAYLTVLVAVGRITITADTAIPTTTVTLTPRIPGDPAALAAIAAAEITERGRRLRVKVPAAPVSTDGVHISGGTVIAGNIGGIGSVGVVTGIGAADHRGRGEVVAEVKVPAGSTVRLDLQRGSATVTGALASLEADINGALSVDLTNPAPLLPHH
ncbi:hypothetical protein [Nocardia niwae]|uniref:hypothetical protein n=1 Tax=Nocardia niwae TaxID=626084 RepID=UPI0034107581